MPRGRFHGESSDVLLDRLDRAMKDEFDAKMLGRVGRGRLAEVKFLKPTLRWHEQEVCFSWSGSTRYVKALAVLLGLTDTRAVTRTRTPGMKATGGGARDALEPLDIFQAATFRSAVVLIGYIVLDRPGCQYAGKAVRSATREPSKFDWMRMLRLAKFLVSHSEFEWFQAQDVPEKYVVCGDADWEGSETRRSTTGACEQLGQHPIEFSCSTQHVVALSSGEAELYAMGRAAAGGLQSVQLLAEAGMDLILEVLTESTANLGMHNRFGSGRVRHQDVEWLWTREAVQPGRLIEEGWHRQQRERSDDETSR